MTEKYMCTYVSALQHLCIHIYVYTHVSSKYTFIYIYIVKVNTCCGYRILAVYLVGSARDRDDQSRDAIVRERFTQIFVALEANRRLTITSIFAVVVIELQPIYVYIKQTNVCFRVKIVCNDKTLNKYTSSSHI